MTARAFRYELDEDRGVLSLHGELDDPASVELRTTIAEATRQLTSDLTVDLARVTFMPSPAIGVLATSQAEARDRGARITLVAPDGSVAARLLTICAMDYVGALD